MPLGGVLVHPQDGAHKGHNGGEGGGGQQGHPAAASGAQQGQAQNPARDAGAHVGPQNDGDGLT